MNKFFYVYLIGGTIALLLLVYQLIAYQGQLNYLAIAGDVIITILLYYMALKVYREKTDRDLM